MKKHDYDKILYRLTNIWQRLREGEILSVKELAIEFNVSSKTIQRDFNERLSPKLPIEKIGHKWKVQDGFNLDKNLSFEEDLVLDILKELANSMGNTFSSKTSNLFSKIQNSHKNPIFSKIEIEDLSNKTDIIKELQIAIRQCFQVEFTFKDKLRLVEPYKITTFDGFWYLYANDLESNKLKTYYIKDIQKLKINEKKFNIDEKAIKKLKDAVNIWFEPNNKAYEIKLLALDEVAKYFKRRPLSSSQVITKENKDGSIELSLTITNEKEILGELKKWQASLLVLEPKDLANRYLEICKKAYDKQKELID